MFLRDFLEDPTFGFTLVLTLVVALTFHEFAHAWSAWKLGDPTAKLAGRLTLDPRRHLDPVGSLVFLIARFGWARPVPIDPYLLGRRGVLWVALAGPASNILLATLVLVPLRFVGPGGYDAAWVQMLALFGLLNLGLAVFNLIPVAPLDGWKVLLGLVPKETEWRLAQYESYGPMLLLFLLIAPSIGGPNLLGPLIGTVRGVLFSILSGASFQ